MLQFRKIFFAIVQKPKYYSINVYNKAEENAHEKMIKVSVIGLPNSGKSTLINSIMEKRVCAVSKKVHTTQSYSQSIKNIYNSQIVVFDTPGIVNEREVKKHKLDSGFISSCRHSIQHSNMIAVLHDISNRWTRNSLNPMIIDLLKEFHKVPSVLILNKIDKVRSRRILLEVIRNLTCNNISLDPHFARFIKKVPIEKSIDEIISENSNGWPYFKEVFLVSSLKGDGIEKIVDYFTLKSTHKSWEFKDNISSDQKPETLIQEFVRARLLDFLPQEIPYNLKTELEYFSMENNKMFASVNIICPNARHEKLVCGGLDGKLKQIADIVTSDIIESFRMPVTLTICTKVDKSKSSNKE